MIVSEISFWYGLSFRDIKETPIKVLFAYLDNLEAHKAEKSVLLAEVQSLPHTKQSAANRVISSWRRIIKNKFQTFGKSPRQSPTTHRAMLAMRGILVQTPEDRRKEE